MLKPYVWIPSAQGPRKHDGLRAFVESHDSLFTVVGALIVFLGFFMKDGIREQIKDLSSQISHAQSSDYEKRNYDSLVGEIEDLYEKDPTARTSTLMFGKVFDPEAKSIKEYVEESASLGMNTETERLRLVDEVREGRELLAKLPDKNESIEHLANTIDGDLNKLGKLCTSSASAV